jgi:hypothetical protein
MERRFSSKRRTTSRRCRTTRHRHLRTDAFVYTHDPDALATEFAAQGAAFGQPLKDTSDGLRGFEISDPDRYVLFFGRPT